MKSLSRLIVNGGVLSLGELKSICDAAESLGIKTLSFGSRQDILFREELSKQDLEAFGNLQFGNANSVEVENIMSSYVASDIFQSTSWLSSEKYLYILEQFRKSPCLKVNITDPKQRLVPLFTGHLNFVASEHEDYWYLYVRLPEWQQIELYPALIYSWDMARIEQVIESLLQEELEDIDVLFDLVSDAVDTNNRTIDKALEVPFYPFPYYEGMNRFGNDKYWLGLYWRNNKYDIAFLREMCDLCAECKIGKISITPWKSFIVKDIPSQDKIKWEKFLGKKGINVRHSMLELNWHLPVGNAEALDLKHYLVGIFDKQDISTYGLTFGITEQIERANYFTSVVIEKNRPPKGLGDMSIRDTYNLLYAKDFNPNSMEYITHVQEVDKVELPALLVELSQLYFEKLGMQKGSQVSEKEHVDVLEFEVYQCKHCLTVYNEAYGDVTQDIQPKTTFEELPNEYVCSICDAPKGDFELKLVSKAIVNSD
ncbi:rubredoxin [Mangrovimonas xylaniphaga]|uniref:rubredoxin n=1 Tax=Mangrovimonas xylaniphaga TaxID=1645915 RepID=UPI0006B48210|nr:rubredoxin [Mangrovimonas xylaniphaga]